MSGHRCAGEGCGYCEAQIARAELARHEAPLAGDQEEATRRAEQAFESWLFGEPRTDATIRREARDGHSRDVAHRAAAYLLGRPA